MRGPTHWGWSLVGVCPLLPANEIPRDPLFGTRAVSVAAQYAPELRIRGQPRFAWANRNASFQKLDSRYSGDSQKADNYVMFAWRELRRRGINPAQMSGFKISGYMCDGVWVPVDFEVTDGAPTGQLRGGPILLKAWLRELKDLRGAV